MYVNTSAMNNMTYAMPWSMVDPWLIGGTAGACACACTAAGNRPPIRQTNKTAKTANRTIVPVISSPPASRKLVVSSLGFDWSTKKSGQPSHCCRTLVTSPLPLPWNKTVLSFFRHKKKHSPCVHEKRDSGPRNFQREICRTQATDHEKNSCRTTATRMRGTGITSSWIEETALQLKKPLKQAKNSVS
jgi:hypothetical protein